MAVIPRLLGLSPGDHGCGRTLTWLAQGAAHGGLTALVLREPHLSRPAYVELARRLSPLFGSGLILHASHPDAIDVAEASGWGLHAPGNVEWSGLRKRVQGLLGMSCHSAEELANAASAGADYATLSPVFPPLSKPSNARPTLGPDQLRTVLETATLPVFALGGVAEETAALAAKSGAHGIASMGHLFPEEADADLTEDRAAGLLSAFLGGR